MPSNIQTYGDWNQLDVLGIVTQLVGVISMDFMKSVIFMLVFIGYLIAGAEV